MVRKAVIIIILVIPFLFTGCASPEPRIKTETQEVKVPLLYCPAPPEYHRPALPIDSINKDDYKSKQAYQNAVVKAYRASIEVLIGYAKKLEKGLNQYKENNQSYDDLKKKLENDFNLDKKDVNVK